LTQAQIHGLIDTTYDREHGHLYIWAYWNELVRHGGEPAVREALRRAASVDDYGGDYANFALFRLRDEPEARLSCLLRRLQEREFSKRWVIEKLLATELDPQDDLEYLPVIYDYLSAEDARLRTVARHVFERFPRLPGDLSSLMTATEHAVPLVRAKAATSLAHMCLKGGRRADKAEVRTIVLKLLGDQNIGVREAAVRALRT
jgi:hypothetical protein